METVTSASSFVSDSTSSAQRQTATASSTATASTQHTYSSTRMPDGSRGRFFSGSWLSGCVFLRDLRLKERLHAGLGRFFGGVRRVGRRRIQLFGLRRIAGPVHHRVDAGQIVLDRRQQLIERKLFQTFFQRVLLGRLFVRAGVGVLFSHVFLPYAR